MFEVALKLDDVLHREQDIAAADPDPLIYTGAVNPAPMVKEPLPLGFETVLLLSNVHEIKALGVRHCAEHP